MSRSHGEFMLQTQAIFRKVYNFYNDQEYFHQLLKIAVPITLQNLLTSSLNMASSVMVGQLGEAPVAAIGLAGQLFFLLNLMLFGMMSGSAILTAQLWGKGDVENVRRVLGFAVKMGLVAALIFWSISAFAPEFALGLYTNDPEVIRLGSEYLRVFCWSFPFFSVGFAYAMLMRTTGNVRLPLVVSVLALTINTILAYVLIFGLFGLPKMGIMGAAWAGLIARIVEFFLLIGFTYRNPNNPTAASLHHLVEFDPKFMLNVFKPILPVVLNEIFWSFGITMYSVIYAHMGTDAIAAINIVQPIDQLAFVAFLGIGNATAITVGNLIGKGEPQKAFQYAGRSLGLQISGGILIGALVYSFAGLIFSLYNVSALVIQNAYQILAFLSAAMWVRASNHVIIIGILRSGGDTRYSLILDGFVIWIVGVPLAAAGAFLFHLPVGYVYALALTEEVTKFIFGVQRYLSRKWINNMTGIVETA
jgi:putative MATE family efflux protein